jgi:threonine synthase
MRYVSTRGQAAPVGFSDAVLGGLAPDGGLYVPEAWPTFTPDEIRSFAGAPYAQVAAKVFAKFAGDEIAAEDLERMCREAYATFSHRAVVPLVQIGPQSFIAELFHGPSLAFKDVAMQILARLSDHLLAAQNRRQTILCATSGDTGGAAVEAFRGARSVRVAVMFPEGRISEVQRRFMTTAKEDNVACVAVDGTFDDCQAILKDAFQDSVLRQAVDLGAVNSINIARIIAQSVYYFTTAAALGAPDRAVSFVVPSGNFGDAFAAYVAHRMGLPIRRIVAATLSPAMDIQSASNFERLYFEAVGRDAAETARAFLGFAGGEALEIPAAALSAIQDLFTGVAVSEAETERTMRTTLDETGELVDPHTAVGLAALDRVGLTGPVAVMSTAHAAKFPEDVTRVTGVTPALPRGVADLADRPERFERLPADAATLKAFVRDFAEA